MGDRTQICEQMALVRSRGLVNARELGEEVGRLGDWREHVRAHPVPIALAAAALGFWAVPAKRAPKVTLANAAETISSSMPVSQATVAKEKASSGFTGMVLGFATSLAGNAIRNYVSQQVQSLVQGKEDHAAVHQRQAPAHRH